MCTENNKEEQNHDENEQNPARIVQNPARIVQMQVDAYTLYGLDESGNVYQAINNEKGVSEYKEDWTWELIIPQNKTRHSKIEY